MSVTGERTREVTRLLRELGRGDEAAMHRLMPLIYDELHELAARYLRREHPDHTLQTTALVHEAYLRLVDQKAVAWQGRAHFFALAATSIRRILVDAARARTAAKRGGAARRLTLEEAQGLAVEEPEELLAIDQALEHLAAVDPRKARVIELRFFAGLGIEDVAEVLGVSHATVERDWTMARAWLRREILREQDGR